MSDPVVVSLNDLKTGISDEILTKAFGPDSLGIIVVKDLPEEYLQLRLDVLKSISTLANLPEADLGKLENPDSLWLTGWSLGKEKLVNSNYDFNKGSYYINCAFHNDPNLEGPTKELVDKFPNYPTYTHPNIWPDLETFELDTKRLCNLIIDVAEHVAINCDKYIGKIYSDYEPGFLKRIVKESTCTKARLLHYFPVKDDADSWCGEHLDHSCLTGLTSALFLDESKSLLHNLDKSPDPESGLYIKNRQGETIKVNIPSNCLAFQSGSALEEISKRKFKAVPHFVKGTNLPNIARNTLAVFCQRNLDEQIDDNENFAQYSDRILKNNH
ncbi:unnamed protein product [Candida verbasci]|uniref:Uncharacterized protein n=1 Tax=Candida verbasci TaxID=1227364 RepID=A0A9W4TTG3_9ASCO|nr:unnamed protein product [Candida verbasci]